MIANFKNGNKLIITGADRAEALLVSQLVSNASTGNYDVELKEFYDIDGDVNGMSLELVEKVTEPVETVPEDESVVEGE